MPLSSYGLMNTEYEQSGCDCVVQTNAENSCLGFDRPIRGKCRSSVRRDGIAAHRHTYNLLAKDPPETTETAAIWNFTGVRYGHIECNLTTMNLIFMYTHTISWRELETRHTRKIKYVLESNKKFIDVNY